MTDPHRIARAINPRPFAYPADPDDPLGPSKLKEAEEERQEAIRRAEGVLVELQAENERLKLALQASREVHCGLAEYILDRRHDGGALDGSGMFADLQRARLDCDEALNAGDTDE